MSSRRAATRGPGARVPITDQTPPRIMVVSCPELSSPELGGPELSSPELGGPELGGPELAARNWAAPPRAGRIWWRRGCSSR